MIRYIVLMLTIFLGNYVAAQDGLQAYSFSDRIGNEINIVEKNYYGFFPKIIGFTSAKVYGSADYVLVKINYQLQGVYHDSVISWDKEIVESVKNYVENLGSIPVGEMKIDWALIYSFVRPQHHSYKLGKKIIINTMDDDKYSGYLMTADSNHLSLWMADMGYNWRMLKDSSMVFSNSEIKEIIIPKKGKAGGGFLIGALLGGGVGAALGANALFADEKTIAASTIVFGAIGGIVGLIAGKSIEKEVTYQSNDARISLLLMNKSKFSDKTPPEIEEHVAKYKEKI